MAGIPGNEARKTLQSSELIHEKLRSKTDLLSSHSINCLNFSDFSVNHITRCFSQPRLSRAVRLGLESVGVVKMLCRNLYKEVHGLFPKCSSDLVRYLQCILKQFCKVPDEHVEFKQLLEWIKSGQRITLGQQVGHAKNNSES
jgi:hypothetical protein